MGRRRSHDVPLGADGAVVVGFSSTIRHGGAGEIPVGAIYEVNTASSTYGSRPALLPTGSDVGPFGPASVLNHTA